MFLSKGSCSIEKKHFWKQHFRRMIQYFRKHIIGRNGRGIHSILLNLNLKFSQDVLQSLTIDILSRCVDFISKFQWHFDVIVPKLHRISETNYVFGKLSDLSGISTDSQNELSLIYKKSSILRNYVDTGCAQILLKSQNWSEVHCLILSDIIWLCKCFISE